MRRFFFTFIAFVAVALPSAANGTIDSLKVVLEQSTGLDKVDILNQISELYRNTNTERAHFYANEALALSQEIGSSDRLALSHINVGIIYRTIGQTQQALEHFTQALNFAEESKSLAIKADVFHKIGVTHLLVNEFDEALEYAEKELQIWKRTNDRKGLANGLNLAGLIHLNLKDYTKAAQYLNQSLEISSSMDDKEQMYKPLVNLGDLYLNLQDLPKAIHFINRSREISQQSGNKFGIAIAQLKLGAAYQQMGDFEKAELFCKEGLKTSEELNSLSLVRNAYKALADIYEESEDFRAALRYNRLYIATEDSMLNEMTKRKIAELELKYNIEQKDAEIERLSEEARYNQFTVAYIGSLLILVVVLALVIYNRSQLKTDIQEQLALKEKLIADSNRQLASEQNLLAAQHAYAFKLQELFLPNPANGLRIFSSHFVVEMLPQGQESLHLIASFLKQDACYVVLADCHGEFQGNAMKKILAASLLHESMMATHATTPAEMLAVLNQHLADLANQSGQMLLDSTVEMAIFSYHKGLRRLVFAGANINLYCVNQQGLQAISAEKSVLGGSKYAKNRKFQNKSMTLNAGDRLYLFTNGLQQQANGQSGKKAFSDKELRNLLVDFSTLQMPQQQQAILNAFAEWRGRAALTKGIMGIGLEV